MAMVAWLSLRKAQKGARYPQILEEADFDRQFSAALDAFDAGEIGREELRLRLERLYNGLGIRKPLLFGRYAKNRDYCLLYDKAHGRFYAKPVSYTHLLPKRRSSLLSADGLFMWMLAPR